MKTLKIMLLAATAVSGSAHAATSLLTPVQVYGGGASLPASYVRQTQDCFGDKTNLLERNSGITGGVAQADFVPALPTALIPPNWAILNFANCAIATVATSGVQLNYISTGSGRGISTFATNNPTNYAPFNPGTTAYPTVHYAFSETSLNAAEAAAINLGTAVAVGNVPVVTTPHNTNFGRMIQIPALIAAVTISFDPVYKKVRNADGTVTEYKFNINATAARKPTGGLKISRVELCKIFNGEITNWNQLRNAPLNVAAVSLKDPADPAAFSVPLQIVGRNDNSGTSSLWTRHLASVCGGSIANGLAPATAPIVTVPANAYLNSTPAMPATLQGVVYNKANPNTPVAGEVLGKYTRADGSDGVAKYLDFTSAPGATPGDTIVQGRIGYLGPDYVLPAATTTGTNAFQLVTADLQNRKVSVAGVFINPTPAATTAAFTGLVPPVAADRAKPEAWVQAADKNVPLADPAAAAAYPAAGTSNILTYSCFKDANVRRAFATYLEFYYSSPTVISATATKPGILASSGLSALPTAWLTAIRNTFWKPTAAELPLNLYMTRGVTSVALLNVTNPGAPAYTDSTGVNIPASTACSATPNGGAGL
jgi:phosphate transport system substrate-binding protein